MPSYDDLDDAEQYFAASMARETLFKRLIDQIKNDFDYIIIDCPPSMGFLTRNALVASDFVFIPVQSQPLALKGYIKVLKKINEIKSALNPQLTIGGAFMTLLDKRDKINVDVEKDARQKYGNEILNTVIRKNVSLTEQPIYNEDIYLYDQKSNGAEDYYNLTNEILKRIKQKRTIIQ